MKTLLLAHDGHARSQIVLSPTACPAERYAALELQTHLQQISGALIPLHDGPAAAAAAVHAVTIYIGRTAKSDAALGNFDWNSVGADGCVVRTVQDGLVLTGPTPRGTLYAVYEFLEEVLGCRWLTSTASVIPPRPTIELGGIDIVHTPPFRYRETFFEIAFDGDWAARNRTNGAHAHLTTAHGGRWNYAGFVHTFYELVPPEKYFESHPEYFSEIDGERRAEGGQLCLTNPELVEVVTRDARLRLQREPEANLISISQNDHYGNCQCPACRDLDEDEGSPSGAMVRFVNAVAERLEPEFPHVFVDTLAYTYSVVPPRHARPRHNVIVRLCNISPVCDAHPLEECEINAPFLNYLQRWGEISPEVMIWDYHTNFLHFFMPFPNLDAICADIPLFARAGVTGVFCQGDGIPYKGSGEFAELRSYLLAKLMWRPEREGRKIITEFLELYYGDAARPIQAYLNLIHEPVRDGVAHFDLYCSLDQPFLTAEFLAKAEQIFDEAAARVAGNPVLEERVATARLPIEYVRLKQNAKFVVQRDRLAPADPDIIEVAEKFITRASRHGANALREGGRPLEAELTVLRGYDLVVLEHAGLSLVIAPALGGRLLSLRDPVTGEEWMYQAPIHAPDYPFAGGYEEYSEARWHSPGWTETYSVNTSGDSAQLTAVLSNGLHLQRTYRIEATPESGVKATEGDTATPSLVIETTLSNPGHVARHAVLRSHPELAASDMSVCCIRAFDGSGTARELRPWAPEVGLGSGSLWLQDGETPAGRWSLVRGDRQLDIRFDAVAIEKCLLDWRGGEAAITLELFATQTTLEPGQSLRLVQRWTPGPAA